MKMRNDGVTNFNPIDVVGKTVEIFKVFDEFMNHSFFINAWWKAKVTTQL